MPGLAIVAGILPDVDDLTALALKAGAGSAGAWAKLVRASYADVWRLCAHLVDRQTADDLAQETYLRAVRNCGVSGVTARYGRGC
jgi:RNA polymerase sigma-70 factor, ECF subfamily